MSIIAILLLGFMISSTSLAAHSSSSDLFSQEDSLPPYYESDIDTDASEQEEEYDTVPDINGNEAAPYDVSSATVTYDKNEYLGDMMKDYFGNKQSPPPTQPPPLPVPREPTPEPPPQVTGGKTGTRSNVGGFGKIDISIQYGCCAATKNEHGAPVPVMQTHPPPLQPQTTTPGPTGGSSRFHMPPPGLLGYPGYGYEDPMSAGYPPPMFGPAEYRGPGYMGYLPPEDSKKSTYEEPKYKKHDNTKQETKRYYIHNTNNNAPNNLNHPSSNNNNNNQHYHNTNSRQIEPQKQSYQQLEPMNTNYVTQSSTMAPYSETTRRPTYATTMSTTQTPTPTQRMYTQSNNYKRYNYRSYDTTTTPKPTTQMIDRTTMKMNYYEGQNPVLVAQEQFYTIQNPPGFFPSTMSPISNMPSMPSLPIPAERSSFYTSERLLSPLNLYGSYMPPSISLPVQRRYYQSSPMVDKTPKRLATSYNEDSETSAPPQPSGGYYGNHVTPRSILNDVSKIVIQDVPKKDLYQIEPPQSNYQQSHGQDSSSLQNRQQQQQPPPAPPPPPPPPPPQQPPQQPQYPQQPQPQQNQYQPNYQQQQPTQQPQQLFQQNQQQSQLPQQPQQQQISNPEDLIRKNRETFMQMQGQAFDLFTRAALQDFKDLLIKGIHKKNIEVLDEEKRMLDKQTDQTDEVGLSILDYLTVYERYSDTLNDTELANHILQDMDRAKEYLNMKLNKFWLELDLMESPTEFLEKKNYYRTREKPTGIMNIFYDWYENKICKPSEVDLESIKLKLVDIMKKERRYWLLLLRS